MRVEAQDDFSARMALAAVRLVMDVLVVLPPDAPCVEQQAAILRAQEQFDLVNVAAARVLPSYERAVEDLSVLRLLRVQRLGMNVDRVEDAAMPEAKQGAVQIFQPDSPLVERIFKSRTFASLGVGDGPTSENRLQSNPALVAEVLNVCFWAGLSQEEGRPVSSGVTFVDPEDLSGAMFLSLAQPERLSVESLVRLGTVAGTANRLALVERDGGIFVWGLIRGEGAPHWVTVWFDRPASVRVAIEGGLVLGVLDRGEIRIPQGHFIANRWHVRSQLQRRLEPMHPETVEVFMLLGNEINRSGHGGALIIVPEGSDWERHVSFRYPLEERSRTLLAHLVDPPPESMGLKLPPREMERVRREFRRLAREKVPEAAAFLASLARIDGAIVFGDHLTVLGFGARIATDGSEAAVRRKTIYEEKFTDARWAELGGTRHQSAARFVAKVRGSAAFVASHDGGLSVLTWSDDPPPGHVAWLCGLESLSAR